MSQLREIRQQLTPYLKKIDALSRRERLLVMITGLAFIAVIWHLTLMEPLGRRADANRIELASLEERIAAANKSLEQQKQLFNRMPPHVRARFASDIDRDDD